MPLTDKLMIQTLRLLALEASEQIRLFPAYVPVADELALLFEDAKMRLRADEAMPEISGELQELSEVFDWLTNAGPEFWTDERLQSHHEWNEVRRLAAQILEKLGEQGMPDKELVDLA